MIVPQNCPALRTPGAIRKRKIKRPWLAVPASTATENRTTLRREVSAPCEPSVKCRLSTAASGGEQLEGLILHDGLLVFPQVLHDEIGHPHDESGERGE